MKDGIKMASMYTSMTLEAFPVHFCDIIVIFLAQNVALYSENNRVLSQALSCDRLPSEI